MEALGLGAFLPGIGTAMSVASGVMSFAQGLSANAQAKQTAKQAKQAGAYNAMKIESDTAKTIGAQQASYAASGVQMDGTPADVGEDTARQGSWDAALAKHAGALQAWDARNKGRAALMKGGMGLAGAGFALDQGTDWFKNWWGESKPVSTWQSSYGGRGAYGRLGPV